MNVLVIHEYRFFQTPDGNIWTPNVWDYSSRLHYFKVFDAISIAAKIVSVDTVPEDWNRADGPGVMFHGFPSYAGVRDFLANFETIRSTARSLITPENAIIIKAPSVLSTFIMPSLYRSGRPYAIEVHTDPYDFYSPGARRHPLRPLIRQYFYHHLRRQCRMASVVAYVTKTTLQAHYPSDAPSYHYTNSIISDRTIVERPYTEERYRKKEHTLVFVGFLNHYYKGPDILLKALSLCVRRGFNINVLVAGDGSKRSDLEKMAGELSISDRVSFLGNLSQREQVFDLLDRSDLMVLPSRADALPRAMIEAMARGLPCIGTNVGGIPELLVPDDMVTPDNEHALAEKIIAVIRDPARMAAMSVRNREASRRYSLETVELQRNEFNRQIKNATDQWQKEMRGRASLPMTE